MKHKSILSLLIFLMGFGMTTTSCEDMLTPDMDRYSEGFSGKDTVYFYLGILRNVQDMVEQNELLGDLRSDLVATTSYSSDSVARIINYQYDKDGDNGLLNRAAYYKVINQCNFYLAKADTSAVKNNIFYMRREYAQVLDIRAWAYLQLVQTYGEVPFITKPVNTADTGWEKHPEGDKWANADNLVDLLKKDLETAQRFEHTLGYPQYGTFNSGSSQFNIDYAKMRFYADLLLGDLYLLRSNDRQDYINAAKNYYYWMKDEERSGRHLNVGMGAYANEFTNSAGNTNYSYSISSWVSTNNNPTNVGSGEYITVIPSAANASFGRVLTTTAQVYGFDASSSNSTSSDSNNENVSTSGSISVRDNYKSRQVGPSEAYLRLCANQTYCNPQFNSNGVVTDVKYYPVGDIRMHLTAPIMRASDGTGTKERFITKSSPVTSVMNDGESYASGSFKYYRTLYRRKMVYLRFAEAINRAGYPRMAFAVIRDGLNTERLPRLADSLEYKTVMEGEEVVSRTAKRVYYLDSATVTKAANYVSVDELRRMQAEPEFAQFLDFSSAYWQSEGIHDGGCGIAVPMDSLYGYRLKVADRMKEEAARKGALYDPEVQASIKRLLASRDGETTDTPTEGEGGDEGDVEEDKTVTNPDDGEEYELQPTAAPADANPLEVEAVETLIADEMALETAFEGTRMFDLIRIARHKNNPLAYGENQPNTPAADGNSWLAWKIARRALPLAPYENPQEKDASLYNLLLQQENWYLKNPEY